MRDEGSDRSDMVKRGGWVVRLALGLALAGGLASCSLGNISYDACESSSECVAVFGYGASCVDGFCAELPACTTGHDCRARHGGGACVAGKCVDELPPGPDGACFLFEPDTIPTTKLIGEGAPLLVGGMWLLDVDFSPPITAATQLAVREINDVGGITGGRPLGMVNCGWNNTDNSGDARVAQIHAVVDYLAGTLGVPYIVGPLTSGDSQVAIQYILSKRYPTVLISPSATSPSLTNEPDRLQPQDFGLFWRTPPSDELQGRVLATSVAGIYPTASVVGRVAAPYIDDAYGLGLANAFLVEFVSGNTDLLKFDPGAPLGPIAQQAAAVAPDGILFIDLSGDRALEFIAAMAAEPSIADLPIYLADGSKNNSLLASPDLPVQTIVFNQTVGTTPASPEGPAFELFRANYQQEFGADPADSSFTAHGYDAVYVGAAGVVFASQDGPAYDGRDVAFGLSHLVTGQSVPLGKLDWPNVKNGLTTGERTINIVGVSGELDFDVNTGQAPAPVEIWQPSNDPVACNNAAPCFDRLGVVTP